MLLMDLVGVLVDAHEPVDQDIHKALGVNSALCVDTTQACRLVHPGIQSLEHNVGGQREEFSPRDDGV